MYILSIRRWPDGRGPFKHHCLSMVREGRLLWKLSYPLAFYKQFQFRARDNRYRKYFLYYQTLVSPVLTGADKMVSPSFFFFWFPLHAYSFFSVYNLGKCSVLYEHIVNIFIITSNVDHQLCFISTEKIQKVYKYELVYSTMEHYERFRTSARLDCVILNYI